MNNICQEKERLEKLKNEAEVKYRQTMPTNTIPLGLDTPKGRTRDDMIKQGKLKQEFDKIKEEYELHQKSCHICATYKI